MGGEKPPKWTCKEPDEITQATLNVHVVYVASPSTSDPYVPLLLPHERLIRSWHPLATAAIYTSLDTLLDKHRGLMHASCKSRSYVLTDYQKKLVNNVLCLKYQSWSRKEPWKRKS